MADIIDTFFKYQTALELEFCEGGKETPTDAQLLDFINKNQLGTSYGITIDDVRKDVDVMRSQYAAINDEKYKKSLLLEFFPLNPGGISDTSIIQFIRKNGFDKKFNIEPRVVRKHIGFLCNGGSWVKPVVTASKFLNSNNQYKAALTAAIVSHAPNPLTDTQIKILIKRNKLDTLYGIRFDDVRSDMYILKPEYQPPVLVPTSGALPDTYQVPDSSPEIIGIDHAAPNNANLRNTLQKTELEFEKTFTETLHKYQNLLCDEKRFYALMRDIFPKKRAEVKTLVLICRLGIVDELNACEHIDPLLAFRIAKRLSSEYGIEAEFARQMVDMWCNCYGRNILHKEYDQ